jgi:hypothetical protein
LLGAFSVCPPWVWLAVRTEQCLRLVTRHSVPFTKRTVWLIIILALIVGARNVAGILADVGIPWFLAIVPAGIIIFFSDSENVSEVVPPETSSVYYCSYSLARIHQFDPVEMVLLALPALRMFFSRCMGQTLDAAELRLLRFATQEKSSIQTASS